MTDPSQRYVYKVDRIEKITDGDTYWLHLDVGFRQTMLACIRLSGFDTPERHKGSAHEKSLATAATNVAAAFITEAVDGGYLWVRTEPDPDDFGRWLGVVYSEAFYPGDDEVKRVYLGAHLRSKGLASKWPTRWREEYETKSPRP